MFSALQTDIIAKVQSILSSPSSKEAAKMTARQLLFLAMPLSHVIETYLYDNEGRPQSLEKFQMMRAIYDESPQRLLLKCSRKTLKSTLLSNMIAVNMLRYHHYKMLYVSPQETSTKYFSNHYLNARLESPPLKRIIQKFDRNDVFEKILNDTQSSVILRYCKEDATRIRGPATDQNVHDESVVSTTLISTYDGPKQIVDTRVGDIVHCVDNEHRITTDRVTRWKSEGRRCVWRVTLASGEQLECTSRSKLYTNLGWLYLAQLLPEAEINRCFKARELVSLLPVATPVDTRYSFGRWLHVFLKQVSSLSCKPGWKTKGLRRTQVSGTPEPCYHAAENNREPRLWRGDLLFLNGNYSDVRVCTQSLLSRDRRQTSQDGNERVVEAARLGGNSLLVHGRRLAGKIQHALFPHRGLPKGASGVTGGLVGFEGHCVLRRVVQGKVLAHPAEPGSVVQADRQDCSVHNSVDAVQDRRQTNLLRKLWETGISWKRKILLRRDLSVNQNEHSEAPLRGEEQGDGKVQTEQGWDKPETQREEESSLSKRPHIPNEDSTQGSCTSGEKEYRPPPETSGSEIVSIEYTGEQDVYDIETEKYHNFFANGIAVHNCQDMLFETLPIIKETMTLSPHKREIFAGTPLTTDNTINELWKASSQCEWMTKCTACNHWNGLTPDNEPMKMIRERGISCVKCEALLDTSTGQWVEFNPGKYDLIGYHLAQPILTHFNQDPKEWAEIYKKVWNTGPNKYSMAQIYNEVLGLAFDTGSKPITEEQLKTLSQLGDMDTIFQRNASKYIFITCGVDWGVNMETSRTAVCMGGLREDLVYEVFFARILKDFDYEKHIVQIAELVNSVGAYCACDSGPDVARGKKLGDMTSWQRTQLVRYADGRLIQEYVIPPNAMHPSQNRWTLHRSDSMTFSFDMMKKDKVLFPRWEQASESLADILNVFIEVKEGVLRQELSYRHPASKPDDFFHALNFALCQAHLLAGNPLLSSPSSSALTQEWLGGNHG